MSAGPSHPLPPNPTIAIVGSGAVGCYYGGRFAQRGHEVHFLLRRDHAAIEANGLVVESTAGDFHLLPAALRLHTTPATMPRVDLVVIALKTTSNGSLPDLVRPLVHDRTVILTLQNGLGSDEHLAALFGPDHVMGGLCYVGINRTPEGRIRHLGNGLIKFGDFSEQGGASPRTASVATLLRDAKIPAEELASLRQGRWDKLLWNIPFNGLGAALDLTADRVIATDPGRALVESLITEVWEVAHAEGCRWRVDLPTMIAKQIEITLNLPGYRSSMQIDRQEGRPLEVEAILGEPLRRARAIGVPTPRLAALYDLVRMVDSGSV